MQKGRKPITLPAGILILLLILMPLGGCQQENEGFQRQLSAADSLMRTDADSAFRMLCSMDSLASRMPKSQQMEHLLLRCNAQNKADSLFTSDSLGLLLTRYFDRKGTPNQRMLAHYVLGCAYRDMGDSPSALRCFNEAVAAADTSESRHTKLQLYATYCQIAQIFMNRCLADEALQAFGQAMHCAKSLTDSAAIYTVSCLESDAFIIKGDIGKAISRKEYCAEGFQKLGRHQLAAQTKGTCVEWLARNGNYKKAQMYLESYVKHSGYFDEYGCAFPGYEFCYVIPAIYFIESGQPDSALYYLRKIPSSQIDADNQYLYNMAARDYFMRVGNTDSVAKYAIECNLLLDSLQRKRNTSYHQLLQKQFDYSDHVQKSMQYQLDAQRTRFNILVISIVALFCIFCFTLLIYFYIRSMKNRFHHLMWKHRKRVNEERESLHSYEDKIKGLQHQIDEYTDTIEKLHEQINHSAQELASSTQQFVLMAQKEEEARGMQDTITCLHDEIDALSRKYNTYRRCTEHLQATKLQSNLCLEMSVKLMFELARPKNRKPTDDEWETVCCLVEEYYPEMRDLKYQYNFNTLEYRITVLLKIRMNLHEIMILTGKENGYLSTLRSRLYKKVHGRKGSAKDFDRYIHQLT